MRSVALGLWVRTGSRDETPAQAGLSHFLEHLLFKGTERFSAIEIAEKLDGLGASVNAATGKFGMQVDELKGLIKDLHKAGIEVFLDVVFNHTAEGNENGPYISFRGKVSVKW